VTNGIVTRGLASTQPYHLGEKKKERVLSGAVGQQDSEQNMIHSVRKVGFDHLLGYVPHLQQNK